MTEAARTLSLFCHIAATVIWIGGLLLITLLVLPELNRALAEQPTLYRLLRRLRKRFTIVGNLALAVLVVTGLLQMSADPNYKGMLQFNNRWSQVLLLKHILIIAMAGMGLALQFGVAPRSGTSEFAAGAGQGRCRCLAAVAAAGGTVDGAGDCPGTADTGNERLVDRYMNAYYAILNCFLL